MPDSAKPTSQIVVVDGLRLHLLRSGSAARPCVVLVHGGCANLHWWDDLTGAIGSGFHVLAVDLRGHGDSQHSLPPAYAIADYSRDLLAILDHFDIDEACFVGHSLGGIIAANLAVTAPQRVSRLALIDSQARLSPASVHYLTRLRAFPAFSYPSLEQAVQRFRLLPKQTAARHERVQDLAAHSVRRNAAGMWCTKFDRETLAQLHPMDLVPGLRGLAHPTLLMRGEHSAVLPRDRFEHLLVELPSAYGVEIAGAYHHVMLDNPSACERALRPFLNQLTR